MAEERLGGAAKWAEKKYPKELKAVLKTIREAAEQGRAGVNLDFEVVNEELRDVLLANLIVEELKKLGFEIFYNERQEHRHTCLNDHCTGAKVRKYHIVWGAKLAVPSGFKFLQ